MKGEVFKWCFDSSLANTLLIFSIASNSVSTFFRINPVSFISLFSPLTMTHFYFATQGSKLYRPRKLQSVTVPLKWLVI